MCGFTCVINRIGLSPKEIPQDVLSYRGPDYTSQINHGSVSFRHWRLSIVDLSERSNQPIETKSHIFVYNGEIYDFKKLSKVYFNRVYESDTLFFRDMLLAGKGKVLKNISGFYSYLIFDKKKRKLEGGRDLWGKKPLYYFIDDEQAIFSSEEHGIISVLNKRVGLNSNALLNYTVYKNTFFGQSYFQNINEIAPGSFFSFDINNWKLTNNYGWSDYYATPFVDNIDPSIVRLNSDSDLSTDLVSLLESSVRDRFKCDVPVQIALSGGVDSASIALIASRNADLHGKLLRALTVKFNHVKDESKKAKDTAEKLGIHHHIVDFSKYDFLDLLRSAILFYAAPLEHPHSLAYLVLSKEVSKKGKVLITGEGADELLFGYNHYNQGFNDSFAFRPFLEISKYFTGNINHISSLFFKQTELRQEALMSPQQSRDFEIKTHLLSLLKRNDRMSMANSVEIRAPFLDIELAFNLLNRLKHSDSLESKFYLNSYLKDKLPSFKSDKEKIGFYVPFDNWFFLNKNNEKVRLILDRAINYLDDEYQIRIIRKELTDGRLGWILCNLGIFLEAFN